MTSVLDASPSELIFDSNPLVLVVEDEPNARNLRSDALRSAGCEVIPAEGVETALTVLRDGPSIDLIVTDIHLGDSHQGRGGIQLAETVRANYDADLPIAAYTGHYEDWEFSDEERALFVARQPKGSNSIAMQREFSKLCRQHALEHRTARLQRNAQFVTGAIPDSDSREFVLSGDLDDVEAVLENLGYELRLIGSSTFRELANTVPVWIRQSEGATEVQVCGYPMLHWEADNEAEALAGLVEVMVGFAHDLRAAQRVPIGPALRLHEYLGTIVEIPDSAASGELSGT